LRTAVRKYRWLYLPAAVTRAGNHSAERDHDTIALAEHPQRYYGLGMSEAIAFDTHRFIKRLTNSGFTERQAETLAEEHVALLNGNLATRVDVAKVEASIETLRQETKAAIEASKANLMKWLIGALIAQGGLIVALVKLL